MHLKYYIMQRLSVVWCVVMLFFSYGDGFGNPGIDSLRVLDWRGGATAAYTIIHDDLCNSAANGIHRFADTIAYNRGIRFGAGAIVGSCVAKGDYMWDIMARMVSHGHEILSHSWSHGAAVDLGWVGENWDVERDVVNTKRVIEENVPGAEVVYMIFPYDAYSDARLGELSENGYLASRSGRRQYVDRGVVVDFSNYDPFRSNLFDAFVSREEQERLLAGRDSSPVSVYDNINDDIEIQHVDAAIAFGGWSIQELHSVDDEPPWGWGRMGVDRYRNLLDYVGNKVDRGLLWVDTPTAVIKYIMTREYIPEPVIEGEVIKFNVPGDFDGRYATELTIEVAVNGDVFSITGDQGGAVIQASEKSPGRFIMDINPLYGDVELTVN